MGFEIMSGERTRVAVVGVGEIASNAHIPAYLRNKNVDLVALVDADKERVEKAAKKFKVKKHFFSIDELLQNQDLDAISVCTPPNTHAEIAMKALNNNVHVLCEKPMATSPDDGKRMYDASLKNKKILMVGFNLRFHPNYQRARNVVLRGRVGQVYFVQFELQSPNPLLKYSKSPWFFKPEAGGGVLSDKGPHVFDLINFIFDDFPCSISAISSTYFHSSVEDSCVCILEYPNNGIGIGLMSWLPSRAFENLSIHGTSQNLFVSSNQYLDTNATDLAELFQWRKATELLISLKFPDLSFLRDYKPVNTHQLEIDSFIQQIRANQTYSPTALSGLNVLLTSEAARKSLETQKKIEIVSFKKP
jgi:UDP-N-acetylglucosamine 3-dehydrogenase